MDDIPFLPLLTLLCSPWLVQASIRYYGLLKSMGDTLDSSAEIDVSAMLLIQKDYEETPRISKDHDDDIFVAVVDAKKKKGVMGT